MAVPKKRRSKSKKRLKKQCWKKKAESQAKKAYSAYKVSFKEKNGNNNNTSNLKAAIPK